MMIVLALSPFALSLSSASSCSGFGFHCVGDKRVFEFLFVSLFGQEIVEFHFPNKRGLGFGPLLDKSILVQLGLSLGKRLHRPCEIHLPSLFDSDASRSDSMSRSKKL